MTRVTFDPALWPQELQELHAAHSDEGTQAGPPSSKYSLMIQVGAGVIW